MLAEFAHKCGQAGDADNIPYFLSTPDALKKTPYLLLIETHLPAQKDRVASDQLQGAVLLFEYRTWRAGLRVYCTADGTGCRNVLAPDGSRSRTAALAARTLLRHGAHIVHVAVSEKHSHPYPIMDHVTHAAAGLADFRAPAASCALIEREIPLYLHLDSTFDATLAGIGQRTRSNLRYYRRRSERDLGCTFVPEVKITLEEFLAFNQECTYEVTDALARWRYQTIATLSGPFLRGIRDQQGRWLSLIAGRRQHGFVEIDWQMNRADLPAYSLATVMRSYIIEYEIAQGSTRLYIEGGTPQPIRHSFMKEWVGELTVKRRSLYARLLEHFAPTIFPKNNYLAQVLQNRSLKWRPF